MEQAFLKGRDFFRWNNKGFYLAQGPIHNGQFDTDVIVLVMYYVDIHLYSC